MSDNVIHYPAPENMQRHVNAFPAELLGRAFHTGLTVMDRLRCERVSPRWRRTMWKLGWADQFKLDHSIVFEEGNSLSPDDNDVLPVDDKEQQEYNTGDSPEQRFWEQTQPDGSCNLVSLLRRVGPYLLELDLCSFVRNHLDDLDFNLLAPFVMDIAESMERLLSKLEKLNLSGINLANFASFLPPTLRQLQTSGSLSVQTLNKLALRCPNLESVPFLSVVGLRSGNSENVSALIGKFLRQKIFDAGNGLHPRDLHRLNELEMLRLEECEGFDAESFEAMIDGCQQLRKVCLWSTRPLTDASLGLLGKLPKLEVLEVCDEDNGAFTDSVLEAIAQRGQLKRLRIWYASQISDSSITCLVNQCKVTERSLQAVIAEVERRHPGAAPTTTNSPIDPLDKGLFYFHSSDMDNEQNKTAALHNPWLVVGVDDPRYHYTKFFE